MKKQGDGGAPAARQGDIRKSATETSPFLKRLPGHARHRSGVV